ncbi:glycosyltransferase [Brooklawnia cerclae]|uniref:UDP:flavonoid glycosyltransferase YjiC (YdhE family) n=1 Tax=Brooklawnia cerclae TaxID=349934 RepID=A0ABX0SJA9_9ACTN|nr:glycosyltransferase [Brooklawnia cerclae]NIH56726.1 UDP:flavonoid glycosyltransferase YjiC (YdhE family) [Brooklawnia cerclae]
MSEDIPGHLPAGSKRAVLLVGFGTRGDVAPLIELAKAASGCGITPRLAVGTDSTEFAAEAGCEVIDLGVDITRLMAGPLGDAWIRASRWGPYPSARAVRAFVGACLPRIVTVLRERHRPGEALVTGLATFGIGAALADERGVMHVSALFAPLTPSTQAASTMQPIVSGNHRANRLAGMLAARYSAGLALPATNLVRHDLGLRPWSLDDYVTALVDAPTLYGVSPHLLPPDPGWPDRVVVTGHWLAGAEHPTPPGGLEDFLEDHPGAVYVGVGSMPSSDGYGLVAEALARSGRPGVVARNLVPELPSGDHTPVGHPGLFVVGEVSHQWLFPRMSALVHHGGAGTTHQGVRAGVPATATPVLGDQPYWGRRLADLGVGLPPVPRHRLTPARLARIIAETASRPGLRERAQSLADALRSERGAEAAAATLSRLLSHR